MQQTGFALCPKSAGMMHPPQTAALVPQPTRSAELCGLNAKQQAPVESSLPAPGLS